MRFLTWKWLGLFWKMDWLVGKGPEDQWRIKINCNSSFKCNISINVSSISLYSTLLRKTKLMSDSSSGIDWEVQIWVSTEPPVWLSLGRDESQTSDRTSDHHSLKNHRAPESIEDYNSEIYGRIRSLKGRFRSIIPRMRFANWRDLVGSPACLSACFIEACRPKLILKWFWNFEMIKMI
jgi:hypothetical protein